MPDTDPLTRMPKHCSPQAERRFEQLRLEQMRKGCVAGTKLCLLLFPAFAFLDYYVYYEHFREMWQIRFATTGFFLLLFLLLRRGYLLQRPLAVGLVGYAVAQSSILAITVIAYGYEIPYWASLVMLGLIVILPLKPRHLALAGLMVVGIYLLAMLLATGLSIGHPDLMIRNVHFLLASSAIAIGAGWLAERLRRESFDRLLQAEAAQADVERSRDILRAELFNEQGNTEALARKITERKAELERALRAAQEARDEAQHALVLRDEFITLASHELNTPLASLNLRTQMAQRRLAKQRPFERQELEHLLAAYSRQIKRLMRMVESMFDLTVIRSGQLDLQRANVDLSELARDVVEHVAAEGGAGAERLRVHGDGALNADLDRLRIEQVLHNLISNAIKYGRDEPVDITLYRQGGEAVLTVKDRGIGIPPDQQEAVFGLFQRAVGSLEFAGMGVGLYLARQIVEAHGGTIDVVSEPEVGSTFTVRLPLAHASDASGGNSDEECGVPRLDWAPARVERG